MIACEHHDSVIGSPHEVKKEAAHLSGDLHVEEGPTLALDLGNHLLHSLPQAIGIASAELVELLVVEEELECGHRLRCAVMKTERDKRCARDQG